MSVSKSRLSTHLITYPVHGDICQKPQTVWATGASRQLDKVARPGTFMSRAQTKNETTDGLLMLPCFVTDSCFSSNVLESKLGGLTVCNASHLSLLSKCKISQCQLGQSPTRVGGASYQAPLAQLPPPACSHPCTRWRINKTSATLWGPACCVIGKLKSEMS